MVRLTQSSREFSGISPKPSRSWTDGMRHHLIQACAAVLAIGTSVAIVSTAPALASDSVGAPSLELSSVAPSATGVTYSATFLATDGMTAEFSSITLAAPSGTVFPGSGNTCNTDFVYDYTNGTGSNCGTITVSNGGATLNYVENNIDINNGDIVGIVAEGVKNPGASGTVKLSTSSDPTTVSLGLTLSSSGSIGSPSYKQSAYTASTPGVTDSASFIATDGLTEGVSSIVLQAPAGTVFPGSGVTCNTDFVYDYTTGDASNCGSITVSNGGATLTYIENNTNINPGDQIAIVATGVTNASSSGTLKISTSSDPISQSVTTSGPTSGPATLQLGSLAPSATATTYQVNFTTTHGLTGGTSHITLTAPSGTVFESTSACYAEYDDMTDASGCATPTGSGTDTLVLSSITVPIGDEVTVIAPDVTNDSSVASQDLTVSDTSGDTVAPLAYTLSSAGKVTGASLHLSTLSATAKEGTYTTSFVSPDSLSSQESTVTLSAPSGTVFSGSGTVCDVYYVYDAFDDVGSSCATISTANGGATVTITIPISVSRGDRVVLLAGGVTSDSVTTAQSLAVGTTSDPTAQSVSYTLVPKRAVADGSLELTSYAKSATGVTWRASFVSVDALTAGQSTVTLAAASGTVFDGSGNVCDVIFVYDDSDGASNDCVNVTQSKAGATIAVTIPFNVFIGAGDEVSVVAEGVTNSSGTGGTFKLSTSSDPKPVKIKYTLR